MKRKSREINIFSMSALDLFASALGAFILIAIVIFPYFPNTSPRVVVPCPPVPAPPAPAPPVPCPPVPAAPVPAPPVPAPPVPAPPVFSSSATQFPHLDLVIALDVTGSMRGHIDGLKAEVDQLSRLLTELTPSLGLGVVAFGDRAWERPIATFDLREISGSPTSQAALRDFVLALSPNMGQGRGSNPDNPEAFHTALEVAAGMGWRPAAELRYIVLITDNPAYPEAEDAAIARAESFAAMHGGNRISTVFFRHRNNERHTEEFLRRVAQAAGGQVVLDSGGSVTVMLLLSMT